MRVSMKSDYALRALIELAHHYHQGQVQIASIAEAQSIPKPFLDQLLNSLRHAGFVRSVRGPLGGYSLARDPYDLRLAEVIAAMEGSLAPIACLDDPLGCSTTASCSLRAVCEELYAATTQILNSVTLGDLVEREQAYAATHYSI